MEQIVSENLFLIEFLVDKCIILPCAIPKEVQQVTGETCVSFKFLDNDPLDICEEDFAPKRNYNDEENMKSGKSCLFAMSSTQAEEALVEFDVVVGVFKKLTNGMLPDKIQIGTALIPIATTFNEIIQLVKANTEPETVSRTLKDCFNITNINDEVIGSISAFLRMSCFGKLIVTQFQMNLEDKSVFFKDKEGKSLYKYRKASKGEVKEDASGKSMKKTCKPLRPISARGEDPTMNDQFTSFDGRCEDCISPGAGAAVAAGYGDNYTPDFAAAAPIMPYNSTLSEKGNYQEIGAEMNGNSLTIRVHKNKGTVKRLDAEDDETFLSGNYQNNPCACNGGDKSLRMPSYQSNPPCTCLAGDKQMGQTGSPCYCLKPAMNSQRSANPCAEKQILSLKPADDPNNPFAFRVSGCPGGGGNQNVSVVAPTNTRPDGMQVTEISDPNKDVFILRIGKKSEGTDKKANLELELVTPKGIDKKPTPKKITQETQYDEKDAGPGGKAGGKGGKGGKGKGGKGGKKGKKGGGDGDGDDQGDGAGNNNAAGGGGDAKGGAGGGAGGAGGGAGGAGGGAGGTECTVIQDAAGNVCIGKKGTSGAGSKGIGGAGGAGGPGKRPLGPCGGAECAFLDKDKMKALPSFCGVRLMKQDLHPPECIPCCPPCYCYCTPAGFGQPVMCCGARSPCPGYKCWKVPSNTNISCSMGKIKSASAKACCYCDYD